MFKTYTPIPIQLKAACWLDAADTRTIISSAGKVSSWQDKSSRGFNATQGTGADQPSTGTTTQNGLNLITFTSTAISLALADGCITDLSVSNSAAHVFIVFKLSTTTVVFNNSTTNRFEIQYATSGNQIGARFGTVGTLIGSGVSATSFTVTDAYYTQAGGVGNIVVNNGSVTSGPAVVYTGEPTSTLIGASNGTANIGEIIIFNYALSSSQMTQIFRYLGAKWGITVS